MKRWIVGGLIAAAVVAGVYLVVASTGPVPIRGLAPAAEPAFDARGRLEGGRALYSPNGNQLAVLSPLGLSLAEEGKRRPVTARGSNVVDAAWFPAGTAFLVAEGPVPTGGLAVVETDGTVRGTVPLSPPVGFGSGYGMTVAPGGRQAVVTAVDRPALGPERRHLVVVDLETGSTQPLTPLDGPDESEPVYVDASTVAFTEGPDPGAQGDQNQTKVVVIDVATTQPRELVTGGRVVGVVGGGEGASVAAVRGREILALGRRPGGGDLPLGTVPENAALVALHPAGGEAVVREFAVQPDGSQAAGLRRIRIELLRG